VRFYFFLSFKLFCLFMLSACAGSGSFVGNSGPTTLELQESAKQSNILVKKIDRSLNEYFLNEFENQQNNRLSYFDSSNVLVNATFISKGDILTIRVIESSPAILFQKTFSLDAKSLSQQGNSELVVNDIKVNHNGEINFPYVGRFSVEGKTIEELENYIAKMLSSKANNPQVLVDHVLINSNFISLVGDVKTSRKFSINNRVFKILDVVNDSLSVDSSLLDLEMTVYRDDTSITFPVAKIFSNPKYNFNLRDKDIVSVINNPYKVFLMGAVKSNSEVKFSSYERSLASILVKSGGFNDLIADPQGVFIFRKKAVNNNAKPVLGEIYTLDMKSPESFILATDFLVEDGDVIYVASATSAELQKFINIVSSSVFSITGLRN